MQRLEGRRQRVKRVVHIVTTELLTVKKALLSVGAFTVDRI